MFLCPVTLRLHLQVRLAMEFATKYCLVPTRRSLQVDPFQRLADRLGRQRPADRLGGHSYLSYLSAHKLTNSTGVYDYVV